MTSRRSETMPARLAALVLGLAVSLGAGLAQAHDPRLDEAIATLQKAEALVEAAVTTSGLPSKVDKKYDRRLERVLNIIQRAMDQIEAAAEFADDALGIP